MTQYHGGNVMGYKRGVKAVTPANKEPVIPMPADLEEPVVNATEELIKETEAAEETVDAIIDGVDMALNIRKDLFNKILKLPFSYLDRMPRGDYLSRMVNDVENITDKWYNLLNEDWGWDEEDSSIE